MSDTLQFVPVLAYIFFVHVLPLWATFLVAGYAAWRAFGPDKSLHRRTLAGWLLFGALGYVVLYVYFTIYGLPPLASSAWNHSFHGAFFGAGYGGLATLVYFRLRRKVARP